MKIIIIRDVELEYVGRSGYLKGIWWCRKSTTIKCGDVLSIVKINHKTVTINKNNTWFVIPNDCYVLDDYIDKSYRSNF